MSCVLVQVVAGFAENQQYGLGTNSMTGSQKLLLIYGERADCACAPALDRERDVSNQTRHVGRRPDSVSRMGPVTQERWACSSCSSWVATRCLEAEQPMRYRAQQFAREQLVHQGSRLLSGDDVRCQSVRGQQVEQGVHLTHRRLHITQQRSCAAGPQGRLRAFSSGVEIVKRHPAGLFRPFLPG